MITSNMELAGVVLLMGIGGGFAFLPLMNIKWKCLVGRHQYQYIGRKSGMTWNPGHRGVTGTMRNMYQCSVCGKNKPIESHDYD
jgi:hypothetical protein